MPESTGPPLVPALREFVVIVLGVLTALGVDAAWEARQERVQEAAYLELLADDFEVNHARLVRAIERFAEMHGAAVELTAVAQGASVASSDSIARLVSRMGGQYRFEPQRASLEELTSTGGLRLLRDAALRRELSSFAGYVDQLQARAASFNEQWSTGVAIEDVERLEISSYRIDGAPRPVEADWTGLLSNRRFRNLVTRRASLAEDLVRNHEEMLDIVERIQVLLTRHRAD